MASPMSNPRGGHPNFRVDPEWLRARADYIEDARPDEADEEATFLRRIQAAFRIREIEKSYEARTPKRRRAAA